MKRILAMVMALALCVCAAAACAETTVESKVIEAYGLELNTKANTLVLTDGKTYDKYVVDTEGNKLSDSFAYISSNKSSDIIFFCFFYFIVRCFWFYNIRLNIIKCLFYYSFSLHTHYFQQ